MLLFLSKNITVFINVTYKTCFIIIIIILICEAGSLIVISYIIVIDIDYINVFEADIDFIIAIVIEFIIYEAGSLMGLRPCDFIVFS